MSIWEEYCAGREGPDSRRKEIQKSASQKAGITEEPPKCPECKGFGEVSILGDGDRIVGLKMCEKCQGVGCLL